MRLTVGRVLLGVLALVAIVWLAGISYVLAVNGSFRGTKEFPAVVTCSAPPMSSHAPSLPPEVHTDATTTVRLLRALGDPATSGLPRWPGLFDAPAKTYDLDGDGIDEVIAQSNDTSVYVFSAKTGRALATLPTSCPPGWYIERILNEVEAGVLRPGEPPSLVVADHAAFVTVWRYDPHHSDSEHFAFEKMWERRMDECFLNPGMDAKATLADVDHDGTMEILVQTEEVGFFALNADGSTRWKQCWAGGNSEPVVSDLDGDQKLEAIIASDSGFLSVLDASEGKPLWTFNAADHGITPASVSVSPTIAELDGVAPQEVLFTARYAPRNEPESFGQFHMAIFAVHQSHVTWQPELLWMRQPEWANPLSYTHLVVTDVDGDASPDIFGMDWNTIGHNPGRWELLGPGHVFRLDAHGEDVWVRAIDSWWSNKDIVVGDTDRDGRPDLFVNEARMDAGDGFARLSAETGEDLAFVPSAPWQVMRGAQMVDLRHDGSLQFMYPAAPDEHPPSIGAFFVFGIGPAS